MAKYFEMHRSKSNILMLILKEQNKEKMLPEQLGLIKIKGANVNKDGQNAEKKLSYDEKVVDRDKKDLSAFESKYPVLVKEQKIENMKQFQLDSKNRTKLKNPDMSFCNFVIATCMLSISVFTFYFHRDINVEYFNRQLIYNKLMHTPQDKGWIDFDQVSTMNDLE